MSIVDGQRVRALESNQAWASKTSNNTMLGIQSFSNGTSGPAILNVQQKINDIETTVNIHDNDIINLQNDVLTLQVTPTVKYISNWDASTNTPTLADGDGGNGLGVGVMYRANVAGVVDFGSGNISFNVGDKVVYNFSGVWEKWDIDEEPEQKTKVEYRTITLAEETAKNLTLAETPLSPSEVALDVQGGGAQFLLDDFTVIGNILDWDSLGLDGILVAGDKVRIIYNYI
jgi:pSer/pThr/pTyr-binding forkhead associated (FHA) protein